MKPVETQETNFTYKLPGGTEENDLPCVVRRPGHNSSRSHPDDLTKGDTTSFWQPEDDDDLGGAAALYVQVYHPGIGRIEAGFGDSLDEVEFAVYSLQPYDAGGQTNLPLSDEHKKWLGNGGHFVVRIPGHPTPPVSVWLG